MTREQMRAALVSKNVVAADKATAFGVLLANVQAGVTNAASKAVASVKDAADGVAVGYLYQRQMIKGE